MSAGFDAVEIHMGHGYLLNQFLSPMDNNRKDAYGGSAENRARFPARVLAAVKQRVGKDIAVLAKINVADGRRRGANVDDAIITAKLLEAAGADMLVLSGGRNVESGWFMFGSNMNLEAMYRVLGKWSLSGMAIGATAKSAPTIDFKELYFWGVFEKDSRASFPSLGLFRGALSQPTTWRSVWRPILKPWHSHVRYSENLIWLTSGKCVPRSHHCVTTATAALRIFIILVAPGALHRPANVLKR